MASASQPPQSTPKSWSRPVKKIVCSFICAYGSVYIYTYIYIYNYALIFMCILIFRYVYIFSEHTYTCFFVFLYHGGLRSLANPSAEALDDVRHPHGGILPGIPKS